MCKKLIFLTSFVLILELGRNASADPNLVAYYRLDGDTRDTGNVYPPVDGKLYGNPTWTTGRIGGSICLDGDDYVDCSNNMKFNITNKITLACWIKTTSGRAWQTIATKVGGSYEGIYRLNFDSSGNNVFFTCQGVPPYNAWGDVPVNDGKWHHLAGVYDGAKLYLYVDGVEDVSANASGKIDISPDPFLIGGYNGYNGLIDDVQLYNRGLGPEEILQIMKGLRHPALAYNPNPDDEETDVPRDAVLSWSPGIFAPAINGHKVFFSENFNDVNDGVGGVTQDANSYAPPQRLSLETTYYWRVDEVNGPPDYTVYKGDVWSFTTELIAYPIENVTAKASSQAANRGPENTVNGSGLDASGLLHDKEGDNNMWLSIAAGPQPAWIEFEFEKVYKLHELWVWNSNDGLEPVLGFGFKDVVIEYSANGIDYATLGTTHQFARAPGASDYAHNTTVDLGGIVAKCVRLTAKSNWGGLLPQFGLSEVRFLYIPVQAREPYPQSGATGVKQDVVLSWKAGREAAKHNVYVSTDEQAVIGGTAPVATVAKSSYGPLSLDLGVTHYWRVDEVNEAEIPTTWASNIWTFTTSDHIVVDDFESYNDLDTTDPKSNRIFNAWIDGYGTTTNGSLVGYENPPFAERTIVHDGEQSMPFAYSNTAGKTYSEAERTFAVGQDWTKASSQTLVLFFYGTAGNTGQLYVKINGSKVVYGGDAGDIAKVQWKQWNIDLAALNVNLQRITKLAVGIDGNGASGKLYFDDVRLYRSAP